MHAPATRLAARRQFPERFARSASSVATRIESWPGARVLAALIGIEWCCVLAVALVVRHNGWVYYQGGDQLWYYTLGWLLGQGELWQTQVGYGWPLILAPFSWFAGPNAVAALPAIVLFNVLVLLPAAMLALYGLAARIGGRLFGYWALALWIVVPFLGILYTNQGYHQRYTELTLPQALGLTAMADFPTMVATIVSLYFCARVVLGARPLLLDAAAAGAAAGFAIGLKPATVFFLIGPALGFAARRYLVAAAAFVTALAPAVVTLAVWKERGLGYLPAAGAHLTPRPVDGLAAGGPVLGLHLQLDRYFHTLSWSRLAENIDLLREHFWSGHFVIWLFLAGLVGVLRRSPRAFLLVGGASLPFAMAKGSYLQAGIEDASLFRLLMPCFPLFIVAIASLPLLVPTAPERLRAYAPRPLLGRRAQLGLVGLGLAVTAVVPLAAFAAADPAAGGRHAIQPPGALTPIPADVDLGTTARTANGLVTLSWREQRPAGGSVFYRVWRAPQTPGNGVTCSPTRGAPLCTLTATDLGTTPRSTFTDRPPPGRWAYRVAVAANWLDDPAYGDPYLASTPALAHVP